jgi:hypothetical protein
MAGGPTRSRNRGSNSSLASPSITVAGQSLIRVRVFTSLRNIRYLYNRITAAYPPRHKTSFLLRTLCYSIASLHHQELRDRASSREPGTCRKVSRKHPPRQKTTKRCYHLDNSEKNKGERTPNRYATSNINTAPPMGIEELMLLIRPGMLGVTDAKRAHRARQFCRESGKLIFDTWDVSNDVRCPRCTSIGHAGGTSTARRRFHGGRASTR